MRYTNISDLYKQVQERKLTPNELEDREKIAKKLPMDDFKKRYGKDAMAVKMAVATNIAKGKSEETELDEKIPKSTMYALVKNNKVVAKGSKDDMMRKRKKEGGTVYNSPRSKVGDTIKESVDIQEDGHQDVSSAIRQCKTITEDAMQIMSKLQGMNPEESLPTWWTNKLAVASNSMNKMRDYLLVPSVSEETELDEALSPQDKKVVDTFYHTDKSMTGKILKTDGKTLEKIGMGAQTIAKVIPQSGGEFKVVAKMDGRSTQDIVNYIKKTFPKQLVTYEALDKEDEPKVKKIIGKLKKASDAHAGQAKDLEKAIKEQPEHEITVGNYTTKHFYMCGSAQTTMKKHADKEGAEELTRMQDVFYKMEKDAMDAGGASDEQKKKSQILYDKIIAKAKEVGIADEVDKYMKMHLNSMLKGDPKLGFGRTDMKEQIELGENAKSAFDKIIKSGGIDKKDFEKAKDLYMKKDLMGLKKYIRSLDTAPLEAVMDVISQNDDKAFMKMYPKSKKGQSMVQIAKEDREQVSEGKMGDYALVGKKDEKVVDVGRLKDMRNQRVKMGRNKYDVYPARGSTPGDTFVTTACPPVNEENTMNQDLINAAAKIMGEAKEKTPRQLVDPKKEVMVVKKNKVIVIDKKDEDKYLKMGYSLAEKVAKEDNTNDKSDDGEGLDKVQPKALKKKFKDRKDRDIDNDGDVDSTDKYLHKRRKTVSKAIAKGESQDFSQDKDGDGKDDDQKPKKTKTKENYEIGKDYGKHTREVTPGQSNDDFNKMVDVMQKKNNSMREALAKVWNTTEGKNPFVKTEGEHDDMKTKKTMTGKKPTKVEVDPEVKETKK